MSLFESAHDLSRRVLLRFLYPFSFREYLSFLKNVDIPPITISDIFDDRWTAEHMRFSYLFDSYLQGGLFPLALEEPDPLPLLRNICLKVIRKDIPKERIVIEIGGKGKGRAQFKGINVEKKLLT